MPVSRVTVFHEGSCARARKALAALRDEGVQESEFHKINLDALTPDARSTRLEGLKALAGHRYTPAVFFNAEYVGSEVEITHLARTGKLARELLRDGDCDVDALPRALRDVEDDERDDPGGKSIYGRSKSIKLETREGEESEGKKANKKTRTRATTYARMTETMKHAMRYRRAEATMMASSSGGCSCFGGAERANEPPTMSKDEIVDALALADMTARTGEGEFEFDVDDFHTLEAYVKEGALIPRGSPVRYALPMDLDRRVLNSYRTAWKDRVSSKPVDAAAYLRKMFSIIESYHVSAETGMVDYEGIALDDQYGAFEEATCELRAIRLNQGELANEDARKAFLLNVYNVGVKHAFVNVGVPRNARERLAFYGSVGYNIGGKFYSLDDIEHGLLRANAPHPTKKFATKYFKDDGAAKYALSKRDARIHFALNCGANACPPIRAYSANKIDAQLDVAAEAFLNGTVAVDARKNEVRLSKIMQWYARDFGAGATEVLRFIAPRLKDESKVALETALTSGKIPRISYAEYDWSTDASAPRPFSLARYAS
jgi:glutaredoxin